MGFAFDAVNFEEQALLSGVVCFVSNAWQKTKSEGKLSMSHRYEQRRKELRKQGKLHLPPTPAVHGKPKLLAPQELAVLVDPSNPELVVIKVGNSELRMFYEDALKVAQWIRLRAKEAKRLSGDMSRHWSVLGTLDGTPAGGSDKQRVF